MKCTWIILAVFLLILSAIPGSISSCKKRSEICRSASNCCPAMGRRMVCAAHLEICGKNICCITEVEEQQEKQAAYLRNRPKIKTILEYAA